MMSPVEYAKLLQQPYATPDQAAAILGTTASTVRRGMAVGKVPFVEIGPRTRRISTEWLAQRRQQIEAPQAA